VVNKLTEVVKMERGKRITISMTGKDAIMALAEGNPGALTVCMQLMDKTKAIDPDAMMGGVGSLLSLDTMGVYASRIWMFYKDFCGENIPKMLAVMRAYQLGQLEGATLDKINHAIDNRGDGLDLGAIMAAVQKELPEFNKAA
jgi:hypothetical protein